MKAMVIEKYGNVPLKSVEMPIPTVGERDVLVEIMAASINPIDSKIRDGKVKLLLDYNMPLILGNDFAGIVKQVGTDVTKFQVGDEIYGRAPKDRIGTLAEYIAIDESAIAKKPKNLTFEEAASIPLVGLTAYQALQDRLKLTPGQKVLIQAGAGGVGTFGIQLAKTMGVYVATTASEAGYELVKSLGADEIINYRKENFEEILQNYDGVLDTVGGETLEKAFRIVKSGGEVVSISGLPNPRFGKEYGSGVLKRFLFGLVTRPISKLEKKYNVKYTFLFMKPSGEQLEIIRELIEAGKIRPVIDKVFPLEEAQKALEYSEAGRTKGKVIVQIKSHKEYFVI